MSSRPFDLVSVAGDLPGLDPTWSRRVDVLDADQIPRTWHLLERPARLQAPVGTMLCLHGNPTWSYLWRRFLAAAPPGWRVIAPDQLGMGWSERLDRPRTLAERIDDLGRLTDALEVTGPVVAVAHDWGGPVLLGWAERHRDLLAGIVLTNTGVALPADTAPPGLITLARSGPLLNTVCARTPAFVRATTALSRRPLPRAVRDAFASPYALPVRRRAVRDFVADIPLESGHPSRATLDGVVDGLAELADLPALLVWGPRDPVFSIRYLHDLRRRLPRADVQLYPRASHLVVEDAPQAATDVWDVGAGLGDRGAAEADQPSPALTDRRAASPVARSGTVCSPGRPTTTIAIAELGPNAAAPISFADLEQRIADLTVGLGRAGVRPGQRVALLIRPGIDLTVAVYACWRVGAAIVVADAGLGLRNLGRALRSADPDHLIAIPAGLLAATALRVPGARIVAGQLPAAVRRRLRVAHSLTELGESARRPPSGASVPSHSRCWLVPVVGDEPARLDAAVARRRGGRAVHLRRHRPGQGCGLPPPAAARPARPGPYGLRPPARRPTGRGLPTVRALRTGPGCRRRRPGHGSHQARHPDRHGAWPRRWPPSKPRWCSRPRPRCATSPPPPPSSPPSCVATSAASRTLLSAGAPVPVPLLRQIQTLLPNAELHTPYGMTEALPATDITLTEIERALADAGQRATSTGSVSDDPCPAYASLSIRSTRRAARSERSRPGPA